MATERKLTLTSNLDDVVQIAGFVEEFVETASLPPQFDFKLNLILDELVSNTINHGFAGSKSGVIEVGLNATIREISISLRDNAPAFNPFRDVAEPDLEIGIDDRVPGGLGVHLVREQIDRFTYQRENGKNLITMWIEID